MSNSNLVNYTKLSPNCNKPRNHKIDKITIHHMAGNLTVEQCGNVFSRGTRQASSNYGIGTDGRVGMYVEECNRSWCSSSPENDNRAITIEVANDRIGGNWHVSDTALAKLIDLCVDICQRNGIKKLNYTGDKTGNLTMHKWFAATACPGPYLESKFPYIAREVNKHLSQSVVTPPENPTVPFRVQVSSENLSIYKAADSSSPKTGGYPGKGIFTIIEVRPGAGSASGWGKLKSGAGWINLDDCTAILPGVSAKTPFKVRVDVSNLEVRKGPGTDYRTDGQSTGRGIFTITEVRLGAGSTSGWGKLKSGAGWINLDRCTKI